MQSKGSLGSIIAGVIAVFLVLICLFYLSFTFVQNHYEGEADKYAESQKEKFLGYEDVNGDKEKAFETARKHYVDSIAETPVWLGYNYNEVRKWGVNLGLDLKGGMSVILQVSMPDVLTSMKNSDADEQFQQALAETELEINGDPEKGIKGTHSDDFVTPFIEKYRKLRPGANLSTVFSKVERMKGVKSDAEAISILKEEIRNMVESQASNVLRNRIDAFGVVAPNIQVLEGKDGQILLELPGVKDHERMAKLLEKTAKLEFYSSFQGNFRSLIIPKLQQLDQALAPQGLSVLQNAKSIRVDKKGNKSVENQPAYNGSYVIVGYYDKNEMEKVKQALKSPEVEKILPENLALMWSNIADAEKIGDKTYFALYALKKINGEAAMDGTSVTDANADFDSRRNMNVVSMKMNSEGAKEWAALTGSEKGYPVAIVLDDEVYSAPNVNDRITGGSSEISGSFTVQQAQDLANVLKSGRMDANVKIIQSYIIGPSLGQQAINQGLVSFIVALVLLMIFMICYYGVIPGLVANFGLILNLFFTFGILASFQAVLTLSGIAGIVLALGMAVDANVLIFERAKEELRAGKNARTAIADGYSNAFSAIFDSNLTSVITGAILMIYGTGPIKGFATTLIIGIVCSFFTAVYLTRIVFILGAKKKAFERLTFTTPLSRKMFTNAHINFLGKRKISFTVVIAVIAIVVVSLFARGLNQGIDFSGGRNYIVKFDKTVNPVEVQKALEPKFPGASVAVITIENKNQVRVSTNYKIEEGDAKTEEEIVGLLYEVLNPMMQEQMTKEDFSTANSEKGVILQQKVGPTVANDMRTQAYIAVSLSLLAMFLYILIRFRNIAFSLGALAAVAFTALSIIGFYSLFYGILPFAMEVDQTFIAAILTIIGYQINDTVVVFDRVRENTALYPKKDFFTVINESINSTLGRTIMTSGSTLLVLLSIFFLGGDAIRSFIFAMIFGVIIGTFATMFVAAPVAYITASRKKKNVAVVK